MDSFETKSKDIFGRLPAVEPSPFFAARVCARANRRVASRELVFWRWIAALSAAAVVALVSYYQLQRDRDLLFTYEPYVIQIDFNQAELQLVASAEIRLPDGVTFVTKNQTVKALRSLKLPINGTKNGRLPFVLMSSQSGTLPVEVKMYDAQDGLINTKTLTLHFGSRG